MDRIPGAHSNRMSLLGEINWIFTAVTDTIAWCSFPTKTFQKLFRQDLLVASLYRNFLFAERLMRVYGCHPCSWPILAPTHEHQMWWVYPSFCLPWLPSPSYFLFLFHSPSLIYNYAVGDYNFGYLHSLTELSIPDIWKKTQERQQLVDVRFLLWSRCPRNLLHTEMKSNRITAKCVHVLDWILAL